MTKCLYDQCCGCIELRSGCLIIGYLNLIGSIFMVSNAVILLVIPEAIITDKDVQNQLNQAGADWAAIDTTAITVLAVILIIVSVTLYIMSVVFLVGIHKGKRGHVKAFLVFMKTLLVLGTISLFHSLAQQPIDAGNICTQLFSILLNGYFVLVIQSYYYKMNDGN